MFNTDYAYVEINKTFYKYWYICVYTVIVKLCILMLK